MAVDQLILVMAGLLFIIGLVYVLTQEAGENEWSKEYLYEEHTPREFEEIIAELWEDKGYNVEVSDVGPDGGIDVKATKRGESVAIEVKRYQDSNKVGRPILQKAVGASKQYDFSKCVVATTSEFTEPAEEAADEIRSHQLSVQLYDGERIVEELKESSLEP